MPGTQGNNGQGEQTSGGRGAPLDRPTAQDEEQLSAYLDGALNATERAALEGRLAQDATLRRALGELRQTQALLRALPTPVLPRSFALPEVADDAHDEAAAIAADVTGALRTMPRVRSLRRDAGPHQIFPRAMPAGRVAQWLGTLVAVVGLALLLGSALPALAPSSAGSAHTAAASRTAPSFTTNAPAGGVTKSPSYGQSVQTPSGPKGAGNQTPAPVASSTATSTTNGGASSGNTRSLAELLAQVFLPALGALLLIGGAVLFAFGRFARPRR